MENIKFKKSSYFISFIISYMFFIYEPMNLYASNIDDFWFNVYDLIKLALVPFLFLFLFLVLLNIIIYKINKKAYLISNIILYVLFFVFYIEGNFLSYALPVLNGDIIDWTKYVLNDLISIVLDVSAVIITFKLVRKYTKEKFIKTSFYISLAIFVMLSTSLISSIVTSKVFSIDKDGIYVVSTTKNLNKYSSEDNFIIFLLDSVDSTVFNQAMKDYPDLAESLNDFTYYKDTLSMHPFTTESVPLILSGKVYKNDEVYKTYYTNSMKESLLFRELYNNNYEVNVYDTNEFIFNDYEALKIDNLIKNDSMERANKNSYIYIFELIRYDAFKYLPYTLKYLVNIEYLSFTYRVSPIEEDYKAGEGNIYSWKNGSFMNILKDDVTITEDKNFKYIHLMGAHIPYCTTKDFVFDKTQKLTYSYEVELTLIMIDSYIKYLKENNIYDNSKIIILSDHGTYPDLNDEFDARGRQNPILFIKGKNEKHKKMIVSDKAISYIDLIDMYPDLINNKQSKNLFPEIGSERTRKYLLYPFGDKTKMYEQETTGKAWEIDKLTNTGVVYSKR